MILRKGAYRHMNDTTRHAYRVLARKYRPETFSELIGQDALVRILSNALKLNRLAHAFVLTGVRGIGKTSTARILAKGLNCIGADGNGVPTLEPCGHCEPCKAIADGRHVDVLEMDAASNTGVDDVREIIEGVGYRPVSARFKIYIIDEVHMMSKNAFNALLKTLEEPPDAVKFILATTEIRKVPVTILSRCQRFDLRRVSTVMLSDHLSWICAKESINAHPEALAMIARAAEGSVRDALSLLDQAAAMTADSFNPEMVADMLGRPGRNSTQAILKAALIGDTKDALAMFAHAYSRSADPEMLVSDLLDLIHLASMHAAGAPPDNLIDSDKQTISDLANFGIARLGRAWQLLLKGHDEVKQAPDPAASCEMLIIRLAHAANMPTPGEILQKLHSAPKTPVSPNKLVQSATGDSSPPGNSKNAAPANGTSQIDQAEKNSSNQLSMPQSLTEIVALAEVNNELLLAAHVRNHVRLVNLQQGRLEIAVTHNAPETLAGDLAKRLSEWTGQRWLVSLSDKEGAKTLAEDAAESAAKTHDAIAMDPLIKKIMEVFPGATIDNITPAARPDPDPKNADGFDSTNEEKISG
jgi:DNA polymerase-3 subunit gamma/tau